MDHAQSRVAKPEMMLVCGDELFQFEGAVDVKTEIDLDLFKKVLFTKVK